MGGGIQSNQFDNGFSNSSLNNTYGSYNQAPNQPKMNMTGGGGGGQNNMPMGGNRNMPIGGNRGGPGPMRGGGRFTNRSSGPYGKIFLNNKSYLSILFNYQCCVLRWRWWFQWK